MKKKFLAAFLALVTCVTSLTVPEKVQADVVQDAQVDAYVAYVQDKLDTLVELLDGKYFTVNQKACRTNRVSNHGCENCSISNIVSAQWFKNLFGTVSTENFPLLHYSANGCDYRGKSCFGFACYSMYYVFQTSGNQKITAELVKTGKFNREFVAANVLPGDVLRLNNAHSVMVYSIGNKGITVVDCNWGGPGQLNCLLQKHDIAYTNGYYADKTVYVERVNNFDFSVLANESDDGEPSVVETKSQYVYYHYTDGTPGEYSVCAYSGSDYYGWNKEEVYREEICVDEPLALVSEPFSHVNQESKCSNAGCVDESWTGGAYRDENGVTWYREQVRTVEYGEWTTEPLIAGEGETVETAWRELEEEVTVYRYCNYFWIDKTGNWRASSARLLPASYVFNNTVTTYSRRYLGTYSGSGSTRKSTKKYNVLYSAEYEEPLSYTAGKGWKDENGTTWWQDASYTTTRKTMVLCYRKVTITN